MPLRVSRLVNRFFASMILLFVALCPLFGQGAPTKYLSIFDVEHNGCQLLPGDYGFMVGGSSQSLPLQESVKLQ